MFDSTSRYAAIEIATLDASDADGRVRTVRYVKRRLLAKVDRQFTWVGMHVVQSGDRLDNIAARYFGDPTLFWRVCDAHTMLDPADLSDHVGGVLRIGYRLPSA